MFHKFTSYTVNHNKVLKQKGVKATSCLCVGLVLLYITLDRIPHFRSPVTNNTTYNEEFNLNLITVAIGQFLTFAGNSALQPDDHVYLSLKKESKGSSPKQIDSRWYGWRIIAPA